MAKRIWTFLAAAALCLGLAGCGGSKEYAAVKKCQEAVGELQSGRIVVTSTASGKKSEVTVTEFIYKLTATGTYQYCQTQYDGANKAVYCEYSDGEKAEQWLIGSGWCVIDPTVYTRENPHRYVKLLSRVFPEKAVSDIQINDQGENTCYTLLFKPEVLNEALYADSGHTVEEETVTVTVNPEGLLCYYADKASFLEENGEKKELTVEMEVSSQNAVEEVLRPELRDYGSK